uniref:Uncharacterized protein n=1 Tax=Aegilops tauschii subsp. strangulata TaxID=200361 RepID=A0A453HY62_AEGTS
VAATRLVQGTGRMRMVGDSRDSQSIPRNGGYPQRLKSRRRRQPLSSPHPPNRFSLVLTPRRTETFLSSATTAPDRRAAVGQTAKSSAAAAAAARSRHVSALLSLSLRPDCAGGGMRARGRSLVDGRWLTEQA